MRRVQGHFSALDGRTEKRSEDRNELTATSKAPVTGRQALVTRVANFSVVLT